MPIDPDALTGYGGDPSIPPFTADRTPDPGITTSAGDDSAATIAPASTDAELTIAPSGPATQETLLAGTKLGTRYTVLKLLGR